MGKTVDVTIPVTPEAAARMADPAIRAKVSAMVNLWLGPSGENVAAELADEFAQAKAAADATGLTEEMVRAELAAWKAERRAKRSAE